MTEKENLLKIFVEAERESSPYVFMFLDTGDSEEVIVVSQKDFEVKKEFYSGAYRDNLTHVMNRRIRIRFADHGDSDDLKYFLVNCFLGV